MELMPGYKQTEVGVIPEDWDLKNIAGFVTLRRGHDLTWRDRRDGDIPIMGSGGPNGFHDTALAKGPGVVLGRSGASFGQAHYCEPDFWPHNTALYVTDFKENHPLFVYYLLSWIDFSSHNSGGAQQSLNRNFIAPIEIGVPALGEQLCIAKALGDVDELIIALEELISKKTNIKHAAMQELLTGKRRLPGFEGEWEVKRLGDICTKIQDGTHFSPALGGNDYLYITSKNIREGFMDLENVQRISAAEHEKIYRRCDARKGDLLLTKDGANTGNAAIVEIDEEFSLLSSVAMLRFDERRHKAAYFMYQLLSAEGQSQVQEAMSGNAITRLTLAKIRELQFQAPEASEQIAIAEILIVIEKEIRVATSRLKKALLLKQGMMQQLLTGKIRLK